MLNFRIPQLCVLFTLCLLLVSGAAQFASAAEIANDHGFKAVVEGDFAEDDNKVLVLNLGARLTLTHPDEGGEERVTAHGERVRVHLNETGVHWAVGLFAYERTDSGGGKTHVPGKLTAARMEMNPDAEMALTFVRGEDMQPTTANWVVEAGGVFRLQGTTSAERIHPAREGRPELLVSMSGDVAGTSLSSDLETIGWYEGSTANFWREAYDQLETRKKALRETVVDPNRVGYQAYQAFLREAQQGLNKLGEGYDMLRQKRYTDEVLKRMVAGRADIPRLDLCSFNIVCGESAFALEVFENWQGGGRVMGNVGYLTNDAGEGAYPTLTFVLADKSGKIGEDTRLVVAEGDAYLESARTGSEEWRMRSPNQFDHLAEVGFTPGDDKMALTLDLDVTGFLLRKGMRVVGLVNLGSLEVTPNSFRVVYQPTAASQKVASDFSGYVALNRIILFPDRDRILDDLRPPEITDETWDFIGFGFDHLAAALHSSGVDQIDYLAVDLRQVEGNRWGVFAEFAGKNGRTGTAEFQGELSANPITFLWEKLEGSRDAVEWLDIDLGFQGLD